MFRIGHGFDTHRLIDKEEFLQSHPSRTEHNLILGGVRIPYGKVLLGHSDADVLIHALCDALLGAAALGDIGKHYPDSDNRYANYDSLLFLVDVYSKINQLGFEISNIDLTLLAEKPKISPYRDQIIQKISKTLKLDSNQVNLKATTGEGLGFIGREEGIAAHAVVLLNLSS